MIINLENKNIAFWEEFPKNPFAKDDNISRLYEKWCQLERLKYKSYTIKEPELPSLTENKAFHSVRNMIIRNMLKMDSLIMLGQPDNLDMTKMTGDIY